MTTPSPRGQYEQHRQFWTPERDATLKRMRAEGYTTSDIASAIGCTRSAAVGRASRMGFETPNKPRKPVNGELRTYARPKPAPKPRRTDIAAKRAKPVPPPPNKAEAPHKPRYSPQADKRAALPGSTPVASIIDVTGCKWPVGDYPYHWCNEPVREGASWCPAHCHVAFQQDVKALKPREGTGTFKSLGQALQGAFE